MTMRPRATPRAAAFLLFAVACAAGCSVFTREVPGDNGPASGLEESCARECADRASRCSRTQCVRGCNLVLDRLAEHEQSRVISCVVSSGRACDDEGWAYCAARVGPHADGGPPAPPPPPDDFAQ
jgi:hypothetical protein